MGGAVGRAKGECWLGKLRHCFHCSFYLYVAHAHVCPFIPLYLEGVI